MNEYAITVIVEADNEEDAIDFMNHIITGTGLEISEVEEIYAE